MYAQALIKRMATQEKSLLRDGAIYTFLGTGVFSYYQYREYIKKAW